LLPWLAFVIYGLEAGWHIKTRLASGLVTADLTTTLVHSYKSLTPVYILLSNII